MSAEAQNCSKAKVGPVLVGWAAVLCMAIWAASYLYAFNELIQWR
jgi:hypothetical protein